MKIKIGIKILIAFSTLLFTAIGKSQTPALLPVEFDPAYKLNYVRTWEAKAPYQNGSYLITRPVNEVTQTTEYSNGLGRTLQKVIRQYSPLQKDIVEANRYDQFGREIYEYLAFTSKQINSGDRTDDGNFKMNPFQQQVSFYNTQLSGQTGETNVGANLLNWAYSQNDYEPSPLNRIEKKFAPGTSWVGSKGTASEKGAALENMTNLQSEQVMTWQIYDATGNLPFVNGYYGDGKLFKTIAVTEHGKKTIEYTDLDGHIILKKVQVDDTPGTTNTGWLCTYYVYDNFGLLRFVIPPKATEQIVAGATVASVADELCFRYEYDQRNRMIIKKLPGSGEVWMVYDTRDRLIMMQDAVLRSQPTKKWLVTEYDAQDRVYRTGLLTDANDRSYHQGQAYNSTGYPNTASNYEVLTQIFYDDYSWVGSAGFDPYMDYSNINGTNFITYPNAPPEFADLIFPTQRTRGYVTGSMEKVLGSANQYLYTVNFYDDKDRLIQSQKTNISGGKDILTNQYSWNGKLIRSRVEHRYNGQSYSVFNILTYDHADRLLSIRKIISGTINGQPVATVDRVIVTNQYDEAGQLKNKTLGNNNLETLTYDYNIRGWVLGSNRNYLLDKNSSQYQQHFFGYETGFDKTVTTPGSASFANPQYNGNSSGTIWKSTGDEVRRKYDFYFDNANRLGRALFTQNTTPSGSGAWNTTEANYSVHGLDANNQPNVSSPIKYDPNGNIVSIAQHAMRISNADYYIDALRYEYNTNSNKLKTVVDDNNDNSSKYGDFKYDALTKTAVDYSYDQNGSVTVDNNRKLSITYNHLSLPVSISVAGKGTITYTYDASGKKLRKQTVDNSVAGKTITTTTTYIDGFVYQSRSITNPGPLDPPDYTDVLQFVSNEEGRIRFKPAMGTTPAKFQFDYFLRDNMGNTRMVITEDLEQQIYPAAALEGNNTPATDPITIEKTFYTIDPTYVQSNPSGINTYYNNNGNPPVNNNPNCNDNSVIKQTDASQKVYRLNSSTNKIGLGITLKVMSGDRINIYGNSWYSQVNGGGYPANVLVPFTDILSTLLGTPKGIGSDKATSGQLGGITDITNAIDVFTGRPDRNPASAQTPKAAINWILLDERFRFVDGNFSSVNASPNGNAKQHHNDLALQNIPVTKNGYLYVYVSNQSPVPVYFDNLQVIHDKGPVLEESHFYPYGLRQEAISAKAYESTSNQFQFSGKELQNKEFADGSGLEMYDFGARFYDNQLGRWGVVDPKAEESRRWSVYSYAFDNPIRYLDPDGMYPDPPGGVMGRLAGNYFNATYNSGRGGPLKQRELTETEQALNYMMAVYQAGMAPYTPYFEAMADFFKGMVPGVDSYEEAKKGNYAMATVYAAVDIFGGSVEKAAGKAGAKLLAKTGIKMAEKMAIKEVGEFALKETVEQVTEKTVLHDVEKVAVSEAAIKAMEKATPDGSKFSVAFETKLSNSSYPGVARGGHFREANKALEAAMTGDANFANMVKDMGIVIPRTPKGTILGESPTNWVWHHNVEAGIMQLVPKAQHTNGSIFWRTMHPGGRGGFAIWGK